MGYSRRLPVYLLLDCSESMAGEAIAAVEMGLRSLIAQLRGNPMALETAALSVITFASVARQVVPLTDLITFQIPPLKLGSGTSLGAALDLWRQCVDREVVKGSEGQKGDYKPLCFLLTDGEPTDVWEPAAHLVRTQIEGKRATVVAVGCGPDADTRKLAQITPHVIVLHDATPDTFTSFFRWISSSVSSASQKVDGGEHALTGLPPGTEAAFATTREAPDPDRYVFLHARCLQNRSFYIMRFAKTDQVQKGWFGPGNPVYRGVAAHAVAEFEESEQTAALKVSTDALTESPPCPYCGNRDWGMCSQGHIHCCPEITGKPLTLTCPWCGLTETYAVTTFDVGRGQG